ncbi:MAG: PIN domain-containing protein [Anaerolineae bacterium]|nr:PIN domain-containing protein [Anaerolineae bacterium]
MADVLVDASYLVALGYPRDRNHAKARQFAAVHQGNLLIPDVVLVEVFYNLQRLGNVAATVEFARELVTQIPLFLSLTLGDFARAIEVMDMYRDAELDFADCCLTALGERLNITQICTFDRRDFSIIRPTHVEFFEMLP